MNIKTIFSLMAVVAIFLISGLPVYAQDAAQRDAGSLAERQVASQGVEVEVSEKAKRKAMLDGKKVTFQDILNNPDDVVINFQFAKQQIAENNVLGAASTLERILLANPKLDQIRLFYLVVLFRLDNMPGAQQEIEILRNRELSGELKNELNRYEKEIKKRGKSTHFGISQSVGWGFNNNRNSSPSSKRNFFGNTLIDIAPTSRARNDTHFLNVTKLDVAQDLPFQDGHQLIGSFTYFRQEQTKQDNLDLEALQYDLGAKFKSKWLNITPRFESSLVTLSRESFLRTYGGSVMLDRKFLNNRLTVYQSHKLEYQNYLNITESNTSHERRGNHYQLKQGLNYVLTSNMSVGAEIGYARKQAKHGYNSYDRFLMAFQHQWVLPKGQFLINRLATNFDNYSEPDLALAGRRRHDRSLRYSATYGAPLGTIFFPIQKFIPGQVKSALFTFSYEYYRSFSNYTNYTYKSNQIQMLLSKRWEF